MYLEVYIDVVFIINLIMDFVIISIECKLIGKKVSLKRKLLGALVGAIAMCVIVVIPVFTMSQYLLLSYIVISLVIVMVVFKTIKFYEVFKLTVIMYFIAIVLGGIMFFLFYYTRFGYFFNYIMQRETFAEFSLGMLLIYIVISSFIVISLLSLVKRNVGLGKKMYYVKLTLRGKEVGANAMLDTGNNLYDPITKVPVIIVEKEVIRDFFDEYEYLAFREISENVCKLGSCNIELKRLVGYNLRLIPYTSIGNDNGLLVGIVVDKVSVKVGKEYKEKEKIVLAIYNKKLCQDNSYNMLLHPNLI